MGHVNAEMGHMGWGGMDVGRCHISYDSRFRTGWLWESGTCISGGSEKSLKEGNIMESMGADMTGQLT